MQFFAALATLLIVLSWAPVSAADSAALNSQPETYGLLAGEDSAAAVMVEPAQQGDWLAETLQTLSPIPLLALGILGLLWIRKHAVEL